MENEPVSAWCASRPLVHYSPSHLRMFDTDDVIGYVPPLAGVCALKPGVPRPKMELHPSVQVTKPELPLSCVNDIYHHHRPFGLHSSSLISLTRPSLDSATVSCIVDAIRPLPLEEALARLVLSPVATKTPVTTTTPITNTTSSPLPSPPPSATSTPASSSSVETELHSSMEILIDLETPPPPLPSDAYGSTLTFARSANGVDMNAMMNMIDVPSAKIHSAYAAAAFPFSPGSIPVSSDMLELDPPFQESLLSYDMMPAANASGGSSSSVLYYDEVAHHGCDTDSYFSYIYTNPPGSYYYYPSPPTSPARTIPLETLAVVPPLVDIGANSKLPLSPVVSVAQKCPKTSTVLPPHGKSPVAVSQAASLLNPTSPARYTYADRLQDLTLLLKRIRPHLHDFLLCISSHYSYGPLDPLLLSTRLEQSVEDFLHSSDLSLLFPLDDALQYWLEASNVPPSLLCWLLIALAQRHSRTLAPPDVTDRILGECLGGPSTHTHCWLEIPLAPGSDYKRTWHCGASLAKLLLTQDLELQDTVEYLLQIDNGVQVCLPDLFAQQWLLTHFPSSTYESDMAVCDSVVQPIIAAFIVPASEVISLITPPSSPQPLALPPPVQQVATTTTTTTTPAKNKKRRKKKQTMEENGEEALEQQLPPCTYCANDTRQKSTRHGICRLCPQLDNKLPHTCATVKSCKGYEVIAGADTRPTSKFTDYMRCVYPKEEGSARAGLDYFSPELLAKKFIKRREMPCCISCGVPQCLDCVFTTPDMIKKHVFVGLRSTRWSKAKAQAKGQDRLRIDPLIFICSQACYDAAKKRPHTVDLDTTPLITKRTSKQRLMDLSALADVLGDIARLNRAKYYNLPLEPIAHD